MKIISATLCLTIAVCVAAQADPKQEAQSYFARALNREEPQDTVSEFDYRSNILAQFNIGGFQAQDVGIPDIGHLIPDKGKDICGSIPEIARAISPNVDGLVSSLLDPSHVPALIISVVSTVLVPIKAALDTLGLGDVTTFAIDALLSGIDVLILAIQAVANLPIIGDVAKGLQSGLRTIRDTFSTIKACNKSKVAIEPSSCNLIADMYRAAVKTAAEKFPGAYDANNEELKSLISASVALLGVMDQYSIASSNDALLASRPIFSTSLFDQYRQEIIEKADSDALKLYAQSDLAILVSISNGLEACLHVAADPEAAAEELAEELAEEYEASGEDEDEE
ncbi:hypothetical protein EC991_007129 [Linnemannia zychae]|nr:hypothetical protein EC991_007129 [Linnemannia zychae]